VIKNSCSDESLESSTPPQLNHDLYIVMNELNKLLKIKTIKIMKNVMSTETTYYKYFQSDNVLLRFVRKNYNRYEMWSIIDIDTDNLIGFLKYDTENNSINVSFENDEFFWSETNHLNFTKVIIDFTLNKSNRTI
jgi:hypothetical protein